MRIALLTVAYPPLLSSGAILMHDLVDVWNAGGHKIYVFTPDTNVLNFQPEQQPNAVVFRFKTGEIRDTGYIRRLFNEFIMPYKMIFWFSQSNFSATKLDAVVMYSPSIFLYPLAQYLKKKNHCDCYLVLRDIFPRWAFDLGLIKSKLIFRALNFCSKQQLKVADIIGVQSVGNTFLFNDEKTKIRDKIEVLNNWMSKPAPKPSKILTKIGIFGKKKIFIYAGNMGKAQGIETLLKAVELLKGQSDIGFLFIGRGTEFNKIKRWKEANGLTNFLLLNEVPNEELSCVYRECTGGLISLDSRHTTHNTPGKFISYINAGLPVVAFINKGNDLIDIINNNSVGIATDDHSESSIIEAFKEFTSSVEKDSNVSDRCKALANKEYSSRKAADQIIAALKGI